MKKSIIYYTDNRLDGPIYSVVQGHIFISGLPIVSASLKPIDFGDNEVIDSSPGYATMVKQIVSCLERSESEYVFFCEHDVLYPPSHFEFTPPANNVFFYNENVWRWLFKSDKAIRHDRMLSLSSLCVNRVFALEHHKSRLDFILERDFDTVKGKEPKWVRKMGYEPGTKKKRRGGFSNDDYGTWKSKWPLVDIRHGGTLSRPKVSLDEFKHKPKWWDEISVEDLPYWDLKGMFCE